MKVTIKDETFAGKIIRELQLEFASEEVSVADIIRERVMQEVEAYNTKLPENFYGLVEPSHTEKILNGYKMKSKTIIDGEKQVYVALDAFQKNGFFMLIDNLQAESLEQMVSLHKNTTVSFVKLTPLVGG